MGADPNSRVLKLTTAASSSLLFGLPPERRFRYDAAAYLSRPEGIALNELLHSLFVRSTAHDFESLSFAVCSVYDGTRDEGFTGLDLRASNYQRQGRTRRRHRIA